MTAHQVTLRDINCKKQERLQGLFPAHPDPLRHVLCCSGRASEPDGWSSPRPARSLRLRSTPWRLSPPQRSGHCCLATRAWRAGRGLGLAAPWTAWSPAGEERGTESVLVFLIDFCSWGVPRSWALPCSTWCCSQSGTEWCSSSPRSSNDVSSEKTSIIRQVQHFP